MKKVYSFLFILIVIVYYLFSNKIEDFTPIEVLTNYNDLKTTIRIFKTFQNSLGILKFVILSRLKSNLKIFNFC